MFNQASDKMRFAASGLAEHSSGARFMGMPLFLGKKGLQCVENIIAQTGNVRIARRSGIAGGIG